jgi:hypothetical protein
MTRSSRSGARSPTERRAGRRGQATIETMLLAFIGVVFFATAFQLYLVNRSVNRTLGQVHSRMLQSAYEYNNDGVEYNRETVKVIWGENHNFDQLRPPKLGMFQKDLEDIDFRIYSHWVEQHGDPDQSCNGASPPCKRTKAGGGLDAGSPWEVAFNSLEGLGEGDYFGWLFYNGSNALVDISTLRDELQSVQDVAQVVGNIEECSEDVAGCAWDCFWGDCPWDE